MAINFRGGCHPDTKKNATHKKPIDEMKPASELVFPMLMHKGTPCSPIVKVGERVLMGQKLAESSAANSAPIHSSVSGIVKAIEPRMYIDGEKILSIVIENDFEDEYELPAKPAKSARQSSGNKVTPMRQPQASARRAGGNMEVCVIKPNSVEDAREITETLLTGRTVILNLEGMDLEIAQRIIDFTSGATFAISGNLQKISNYIFLVTPTNVDISGDLQDLLNTSFDASSMRSRF